MWHDKVKKGDSKETIADISLLLNSQFVFQGKDDAGYSALTTRMRQAKLTCQEILGMFQAR